MNVTLTFLSFSGSAGDFASVERFFAAQAAAGRQIITATASDVVVGEPEEHDEPETPDDNSHEIPAEAAFLAVIRRVPLNAEYRSYIRAVHDAGEEGTTIADIASRTGQPEARVKSAFRNFGKRTVHTPEWPRDKKFFRQQWRGTQNRYWLHSAMRHAIDGGRIAL